MGVGGFWSLEILVLENQIEQIMETGFDVFWGWYRDRSLRAFSVGRLLLYSYDHHKGKTALTLLLVEALHDLMAHNLPIRRVQTTYGHVGYSFCLWRRPGCKDAALGYLKAYPDPQKDLKIRSPRTIGGII